MDEEVLTEGVLVLLQRVNPDPNWDYCSYTFEEIFIYLRENGLEEGKEGIKLLKYVLDKMEEEKLIELRSCQGNRSDYCLENKGIDLIMKKRREAKLNGINLDNKWNLSD